MKEKPPKPLTPFDSLVIPSHLQMLKLLLPYIASSDQRFLAVFIKFLELQYTIRFFQNFKTDLHVQAFDKKISSPYDIVEELIPYLDKEQGEMLQNMQNAIQMAEMFRNVSDLQSGAGFPPFEGFSADNMMKSMLTPEQQEMFDFYSNMFSQNTDTAYDNKESDANKEDSHGKLDESSGSEQSGPDENGTFEDSVSADRR